MEPICNLHRRMSFFLGNDWLKEVSFSECPGTRLGFDCDLVIVVLESSVERSVCVVVAVLWYALHQFDEMIRRDLLVVVIAFLFLFFLKLIFLTANHVKLRANAPRGEMSLRS